jgi:hypothetical protein
MSLLGLIFLYYSIFLFIIKLFYRGMNAFLIKNKLVSKAFLGKDFTYASLNDSQDDIWDEKLATKPSWFDTILSFLLFIIPMLLAAMIASRFLP